MPKYFKIILPFLISIIFIFGFAETVNLVTGGWYQQFMPNLNGRQINDITFTDSLTGYAITNSNGQYDTAFILKTTNAGDNWSQIYFRTAWFSGFNKIKFLNLNTGYVCGVSISNGPKGLTKTTNGGINWFDLNIPDPYLAYQDMSVLNEDTIWLVHSESLTGGVFRTTNGGVSWQQQFSGGNQNPNKIYMYNARIGFFSNITPNIYRTTNSGVNWSVVLNKGFNDIFLIDSLQGWMSYDSVRKTTDGGLIWKTQLLPYGGIISNFSRLRCFSYFSKDTIWGGGGYLNYGSGRNRGILYYTTNGGSNWRFQLPDTGFGIPEYDFIKFINKNYGWAYLSYFPQPTGSIITSGIHTITGGDTNWLFGIQQISNEVPKDYKLYQNFPNPFNPVTNIKYQVASNVKGQTSNVRLVLYDITGKEVIKLVDQEQKAGTYQVDFSGNGYASGIYFYSLIADGATIETRKMVLVK